MQNKYVGIFIVAIILILLSIGYLVMNVTEKNKQDIPIVRAALNEHWNSMIANSTYKFSDLHRLYDDSSYIMTDDPIILEYSDPNVGVTFPATRFLRINTIVGRVMSITLTPHLSALDIHEAFKLLEKLNEKLSEIGWEQSETRTPIFSIEEFQARAIRIEKPRFSKTQAEWKAGQTGLRITIKRIRKVGPDPDFPSIVAEKDRYIVEVRIYDLALSTALYKKMHEKRQELYGNTYERVPLNYWLENE